MVVRLSKNKWLAIAFTCKNKNYDHLFGPFWLLDIAPIDIKIGEIINTKEEL